MRKNTIFNQDCLKTMKRMEDSSIDLVVTSPPYNMNLRISNGKYHSRQVTKELTTKYSDFSDNLPIEEFYKLHLQILKELIRVSDLVFKQHSNRYGFKKSFFKIIGDLNEYR